MGLISRDQILSASDIEYKEIDVPEWGGTVRIASMNGADREVFETVWINQAGEETTQIRATLVALSIVDENGDRLFSPEDIEALGKKSCKALSRVFEVAQKLNGIGEDDVKN